MSGPVPRSETPILHVDMDAFFVAVEIRRRPELSGLPVVVGGTGDRGVVAAASYEARTHGVGSAMASARARRLCPHAVFLPGDHAHYSEVSARVMALFRSFTPLVEPLSLDEAFLDVGGALRLLGEPEVIGAAIRDRVLEQEDLPCSVGVAPNKFLAKLASEAAKPDVDRRGVRPGQGVVVVPADGVDDFLHPLAVEALWGVGPRTRDRLARMGVATVGDLAAIASERLVDALGEGVGHHLHALAHGRDERRVEPRRAARSIGHEETFVRDHRSHETLAPELTRLGDSVAARLRSAGLAARTLVLKVRFADFVTITRSTTFTVPVDDRRRLTRTARQMLGAVDVSRGVRLIGLSGAGLVPGDVRQLSLDDPGGWSDADRVVDEIRDRFGRSSIVPAALTGPDGPRVKGRGDQQWGPDGAAARPPDET